MNVPPHRLAAIALLAGLACGCASELTGNHGRFVFSYASPYHAADFNKPIAPGAQLDIHARSLGRREHLDIVSAESTDPNVLRVTAVFPSAVIVQGAAFGTARLRVTTEDGLQDEVDMRVATPDAVRLSHACTDGNFAVYPANGDIRVPFRMVRDNEETVIGHGFWPIKVTPASAMALDREARDQSALHFRTGKPRHRVAIRSTIDDTILGLALVENQDVTEVHVDGSTPSVMAGERTFVSFTPSVEGIPFCQSNLLTLARGLTPETCSATARLDDDGDGNRDQIVQIFGRAFGICEVEVLFPEANGGDGVRHRLRVPVGALPSLERDDAGTSPASWPPWLGALLALVAPLSLLPLALGLWRRGR